MDEMKFLGLPISIGRIGNNPVDQADLRQLMSTIYNLHQSVYNNWRPKLKLKKGKEEYKNDDMGNFTRGMDKNPTKKPTYSLTIRLVEVWCLSCHQYSCASETKVPPCVSGFH